MGEKLMITATQLLNDSSKTVFFFLFKHPSRNKKSKLSRKRGRNRGMAFLHEKKKEREINGVLFDADDEKSRSRKTAAPGTIPVVVRRAPCAHTSASDNIS
jgi:hypothetical protein